MSKKELSNNLRRFTRREFLKDAGIVVGTTVVGSAFFLSSCGKEVEVTKTVTTTAPGATNTVTKTATAATATITVTKYFCPVDNLEFDSLEELKAHFDAVHGDSGETAGLEISFTLNGEQYTAKVEPNWDLQYFLHDVMGMIDIKTFCYRGACGSCTVIMDGRPILSCMTLAIDANGKTIETAQGIALSGHPLIDSYIKYQCMQCGYCTPGFITTAKALLDHNSSPTDQEIIESLSGNLCRCGTYPVHIPAIKEAAAALKGGA